MPITIADQTFRTKEEAKRSISALLKELGAGTIIDPAHARFPFFKALFNRHPERDEKYGSGLLHFLVALDSYGKLMVRIMRTDGTDIDASFHAAVKGTNASVEQNLRAAMRCAITEQVDAARQAKGSPTALCPECKEPLGAEEWHVDHEIHFDTLVSRFLALRPDHPVKFDDGPTHAAVFRAKDEQYARAWIDYHEQHASLRVVHKRCNLSRAKAPQNQPDPRSK